MKECRDMKEERRGKKRGGEKRGGKKRGEEE